MREAERGIGGTGIAGVIQGFASVCVDGLEIAANGSVPVAIDGQPASMAALRVGQFVTIAASLPGETPRAGNILARHEVVGPVEDVLSVQPALAVVAGQRVRIPSSAIGDAIVQPGAWVAVSGLRGPDGDIIASRVDSASPGRVLVHGPLISDEGVAAIGSMPIQTARVAGDLIDTFVVASGTYVDGVLAADSISPDLLLSNPPAYFGPETKRLVLQTTARYDAGVVKMTGGYKAESAAAVGAGVQPNSPAVITLQARPDGSFAVIKVHGQPRFGPLSGPAGPVARPGRGVAAASAGGAAAANTRVVTVTIDYQLPPASGGAPTTGIAGSEVVALATRPDGSLTPISVTARPVPVATSPGGQPTGSGASAPATGGSGSTSGVVTITIPYGTTPASGATAAGVSSGSAVVTLAARPDGSYSVTGATAQSGVSSDAPAGVAASVTTGSPLVKPMVLGTPSPLGGGGVASHLAGLPHGRLGGGARGGLAHTGLATSSMTMRHTAGLKSFSFRFKMGH
jgi:hypothetical protein